MAALQRAHAAREVTGVLSVGADFIARGAETLSLPAVYAVLDELEEAWQACRGQLTLSAAAREEALRHYHAVHTSCARAVPLTAARWQQWLTSIASVSSDADVAESASSASGPTHELTVKLVEDFMQLFLRHRWGHPSALKVALDAALVQANAAAAAECTSNGTLMNADDVALAHLETALAKPLQAFARLAAESTHLFASYAAVGQCERMWLNETVGAELGEPAEAAVEALVRRSFKRDLQVPSAALPQLLEEYEASEVEERKTKAILSLGHATLRSPWMRAAAALHAYEVERQATVAPTAAAEKEEPSGGHTVAASACETDTRWRELDGALTKELRKLPKARGCLPALGTLTGRLTEELDHASSNSLPPPPWVGVSESQTHFYLYLLQQWFGAYVSSHHRWSAADMFCAVDDADLWSFVLDRHSVCLAWSLASAQPLAEVAGYADVDSRCAFLAAVKTNTEKLRTVLYSVAHCLQVYRASVTVFTRDEKREVRLRTAAAEAQQWLQKVGAETFCRSLLNDMWSVVEDWQSASCGGEVSLVVDQQAMLIEAEVKIILHDAMQLLDCADATSTERLESAVESLLDFCQVPRDSGTASGHPAARLPELLSLPMVRTAERCLRRISTNLRRALSTTQTPSEAHTRLFEKAVGWIKQCVELAVAHDGDTGALWDLWTELTSAPLLRGVEVQRAPVTAEGSSGGRDVTQSMEPSIPAFVGYVTAAQGGSRGVRQNHTGGDLAAICWERRSAAKKARQHHRGGVGGGGGEEVDADVPSPAGKDDVRVSTSRGAFLETSSKRPRDEDVGETR